MVFCPSCSSCFLIEAAVAAVVAVSTPQPLMMAVAARARSVLMGAYYRCKALSPQPKSSASGRTLRYKAWLRGARGRLTARLVRSGPEGLEAWVDGDVLVVEGVSAACRAV